MKLECRSCGEHFALPVSESGKVRYARCQNIFQVAYRFRAPCPRCRKVLSFTPGGRDRGIGVPIEFARDEATEQIEEVTLPRAVAMGEGHTHRSTVRVNLDRTASKPSFRMIETPRARPSLVHVPIRKKMRRPKLPIMKIAVAGLIVGGVALTVCLTWLALQPKSPESLLPTPPLNATPSAKAAKPEKVPDSRGGPAHDTPTVRPMEAIEDEMPKAPKKTVVTPVPHRAHADALFLPDLERLTSTYGDRIDPFEGEVEFHGGIDIAKHARSEVPAALPGIVSFVGKKGGYGTVVVLRHAGGYETLYAHLEKALVRKGTKVREGDPVGLAGSTGRSTGPHLHFELHKNGKKIDPLRAKLISKIR